MIQSGSVLFRRRGVSSAKKYLFITLLLSSVCLPVSALATDADVMNGDTILGSLLAGNTSIDLQGTPADDGTGFVVPNPGDPFDGLPNRPETWFKNSQNLTFQGYVVFYDNNNIEDVSDNGDVRLTYHGGVFDNEGNLNFVGNKVVFGPVAYDENKDGRKDSGNAIVVETAIPGAGDLLGYGAAIRNTGSLNFSSGTQAVFDSNGVILGITGDSTDENRTEALGGAVYNSGTAYFGSQTEFKNSFVVQYYSLGDGVQIGDMTRGNLSHGGAYYNAAKGSTTFAGPVSFANNVAYNGLSSLGGGLYNGTEAELLFKKQVDFEENLVETDQIYAFGGGLNNTGGTVEFEDKAVFKNNKAELTSLAGQVAGGAGMYTDRNVYSQKSGEVYFKGDAEFLNNSIVTTAQAEKAIARGSGLMQSGGKVIFDKKASFVGNEISANGKLSHGVGGGVHVIDYGNLTFNSDVEFKNNKITAGTFATGGGLDNYGTVTFNADASKPVTNILFEGNVVKNTQSDADPSIKPEDREYVQARGAALYNGQGSITFNRGTNVVFKNNKVETEQAKAYGGAVYNDVYTGESQGEVNFFGDTQFIGNEAATGGGAIFNRGKMSLNGQVLFEGNKASLGGGIYNDKNAEFLISGNNVAFKDNQADLGANIYNLGTVKVHNVHDIMDVDYEPYTTVPYPKNSHTLFDKTGDIYNKGAIEIDHSDLQLFGGINTKQKNKEGSVGIEESRVDLGTNTIYADTVDIKKNSKVITHIENGSNGKIEANTVSISNENTSLGIVVGVGEIKKGETKEYQIVNASKTNGDFQHLSENMLYEVKEKQGADGVYQIRKLTDGEAQLKAEEAAKNPYCKDGKCDEYSKEASNAWIDNEKITGNEQATAMQEKLNELAQLNGTNTDDYQDAINALTPDSSALITAHSSEVTRQISNALGQRFYDAMEKSHFVYNGKVHYKAPKETSRVWVNSLYSMGENDGKKPFEMDTIGFIAGVETPIDRNLKVGAAYSYSFSDGKGMNRDTEIQTHAGIIYGQYQPNRFYANGFLMYGRSTVKEERNVLSQKVESEYDINIAAAEMIAGYKLGPVVVGKWVSGVLSPEAGLRYVYTKQKEYTDTLGQTVEAADAHALTGILGARYTVGYSLSPSIQWYPELRAAVTYDFISPSMDNQVVLLNGAGYTLESEEMDKFGIEIGLKVGFEIDKRTEIGLEYEGLFKGDYTNHTGTANVKYNF